MRPARAARTRGADEGGRRGARGGPSGRASGRAKICGARPRAISDPAEEEEDEVSVASGVADAAADEKKTSWGFLSPFGASSAVLEQASELNEKMNGRRKRAEEVKIKVDGQWYDASGWALAHPGGAGFVRLLNGQDATDVFLRAALVRAERERRGFASFARVAQVRRAVQFRGGRNASTYGGQRGIRCVESQARGRGLVQAQLLV